jgi:hypothetical protein
MEWATVMGLVGALLEVGLIAGVVARHRVAVCYSFIPYLVTVAGSDLLIFLWPREFNAQWFWLGSQTVVSVLRFAVALELTYRTFRAFPGARGTARLVLLVVLLATFLLVVGGTQSAAPLAGGETLGPLITRVQPRILNGTIWLLTAVAGLILWYRLPVHPFHKAILTGLVPYLLVFTTALNLLETEGWQIREDVNHLNTGAYVLLLGYWTWAAWRTAKAPARATESERALEHVPG